MAFAKKLPSQENLRMFLDYDHSTGSLTWKARGLSSFEDGGHGAIHNRDKWNGRWAGAEAFTAVKGDGYRHGAIDGRTVLAHRVIWKWMTGDDAVDIDHIDGNRANNRWSNLRSVTRAENIRNSARHKDNSSGVTGVRFVSRGGLWQAYLYEGRKFVSLGSYKNKDDAIAARKRGDKEHGFHKNHGREATNN